MGAMFIPVSLIALSRVRDADSGLSSSLLNIGQQVGGAIGLAALGTVTWTVAANSLRSEVARAGVAAAGMGHAPGHGQVPVSWHHKALAEGISRGLIAAAALALCALIISVVAIRAGGEEPVTAGTPTLERRSWADA